MNDITVALLGTGAMGEAMARNIAGAGIPTRVWNRTREKAEPLGGAGVTVCNSPGEAVDGTDVVVTMLWDADSVEKTLREARESLAPGSVLLQTTTVGVDGAARLGRVAALLGLEYVDAPVLGTKGPAEQGTLMVLASGPKEVEARISPVLDAIGARTLWVGDAGAGSRLKLAANAFAITLTGALAQSLVTARALGVDPALFLEAVADGPMDSPYVRMKGTGMLEEKFTSAFGITGAVKDADLILEAVRAQGVDLPVLAAVKQQLRSVDEAGHGDEDVSAVYRVYDEPR